MSWTTYGENLVLISATLLLGGNESMRTRISYWVTPKQSYGILPSYLHMLRETNLGIVVNLEIGDENSFCTCSLPLMHLSKDSIIVDPLLVLMQCT